MGVGMNEASKLVGAMVTAGVASRMIGDEKNQTLAQGQKAAEDMPDTLKEKETNEMDIAQKELDINAYENQADTLGKQIGEKLSKGLDAGAEKLQQAGVMSDLDAAKEALSQLEMKQTAIAERLQRQRKAMVKGRRWGGAY